MNLKKVLILFPILFSFNSFAQKEVSLLDSLFIGGQKAYDSLVKEHLKFPYFLMGEVPYGTIVFEIAVNPTKEINVKILSIVLQVNVNIKS